jgi:hypothetical protein
MNISGQCTAVQSEREFVNPMLMKEVIEGLMIISKKRLSIAF